MRCSLVAVDGVRVFLPARAGFWRDWLRRICGSRHPLPHHQCPDYGAQHFRLGFRRDLSGDSVLRREHQAVILAGRFLSLVL